MSDSIQSVYDNIASLSKEQKQEEKIKQHIANRDKYKIDVTKELPPQQIAWSLKNTLKEGSEILGTLGNFSLLIGKAKAKKSFTVAIAVAVALNHKNKGLLDGRFINGLPLNQKGVLYFDTEQGEFHVQQAVKRVCAMIKEPEPTNLIAYHLREHTPANRLNFIDCEIQSRDDIGFVVIDGIKDLVTSINDEEQACEIASKLLKWSKQKNIHILTVLHQNKTDLNARGHIGTELQNKAEITLSVTVEPSSPEISTIKPDGCRNKEPEEFSISIDQNGLPFIVSDFERPTSRAAKPFAPTDIDDELKYKVLKTVFKNGESFKRGELSSQIKIAYKKVANKSIGDNKIKDLITYCKNIGWLIQKVNLGAFTLGEFSDLME